MKINRPFLRYSLRTLVIILALFGLLFAWINLPVRLPREDYSLGVTFSVTHSRALGLDWQANYLALLDDLGIRKMRLPVYWNAVEPREGEYDFSDLDWQVREAEKRGVQLILAVGQKVPRWPECFIPDWAKADDAKRQAGVINIIEQTVRRYQSSPAVRFWQVENEPFLKFGECPPLDADLLDREIATVRRLDPSRPVLTTDSGEISPWFRAAKRGDVFGTTMYREVVSRFGHWKYPIGPNFFKLKRWLISRFVGQDNVIVVELQGEPWLDGWTINFPLEEQFRSMDPAILADNVSFARKTGIREIYLWGGEWWYWLKIKKDSPQVWEEARRLVQAGS